MAPSRLRRVASLWVALGIALASLSGLACAPGRRAPTVGARSVAPAGQVSLGPGHGLVLLEPAAASERVARADAFFRALTPLDRRLRLGVETPVDGATFVRHVRAQVRPFEPAHVDKLARVAGQVGAALSALGLLRWLPEAVQLVHTTGAEEGLPTDFDLSYTRDGVIYVNTRALAVLSQQLLLHELFHVLCAAHPAQRDALYASIGFARVARVDLTQRFEPLRLATPEVPRAEHGIRVRHAGSAVLAVPMSAAIDGAPGGSMFDVEGTRWALVGDGGRVTALVDASALDGLTEQVGRNTPVGLGPEEILAENFVLFALGVARLPSPEVIARMRAILVAP